MRCYSLVCWCILMCWYWLIFGVDSCHWYRPVCHWCGVMCYWCGLVCHVWAVVSLVYLLHCCFICVEVMPLGVCLMVNMCNMTSKPDVSVCAYCSGCYPSLPTFIIYITLIVVLHQISFHVHLACREFNRLPICVWTHSILVWYL
jgi:hypothetical protein